MTNRYTLPTGLHFFLDDRPRCDDCNAWAYEGETIHHSKRCDTPSLQAERVAPTAKVADRPTVVQAAREGDAYAQGYDEDDLILAVRCGALSVSDAMNQDF